MSDWYIVGRGASLLTVKAREFGPGPVIALNQAIVQVRQLHLPNPIYTMQKDGCIRHDSAGNWANESKACGLDFCGLPPMVRPRENETLIVVTEESPHCFHDHPKRIVVDVAGDLGVRWNMPSAPVAVLLAAKWGATRIHMFAFDSYLNGDLSRVDHGDVVPTNDSGYAASAWLAEKYAKDAGVELVWRPVTSRKRVRRMGREVETSELEVAMVKRTER